MYHKRIPAGEIHAIQQWVAANTAARLALSVVSTDVGKVCLQSDTQEMWWLASEVGPIWKSFGGSVGAFYEYPIDIPPGSPGALDDEFNGTGAPSGWTWLNQTGGSVTCNATQEQGWLTMQDASALNAQFRWLYKALPAFVSAQTFTCKIRHDGMRTFNNSLFAILNVAANTGTAVRLVNRTDYASVPTSGWLTMSNLSSGAGTEGNQSSMTEISYMRIVRNPATTYTFYLSQRGKQWVDIKQITGYTADSIAIGHSNSNTAANNQAATLFNWFRQT